MRNTVILIIFVYLKNLVVMFQIVFVTYLGRF